MKTNSMSSARTRYVKSLEETLSQMKGLFYFILIIGVISLFADYIFINLTISNPWWGILAVPETIGVAISLYLCYHWGTEVWDMTHQIEDIKAGRKPIPIDYYWEDGTFRCSNDL